MEVAMRRPAPCAMLGLALLFCAYPAHAFDPPHLWSQSHGGLNAETSHAIAVDAAGNVYVSGFFSTDANFGGVDLINPGGPSDLFVAKYNAAGVHQWSRSYGGLSGATGWGMQVDGAGSVIVTGHFGGSVDFGGGALVSAGLDEIFLVKLNTDGVHQWSQRFGAAGNDAGLAL